MKIGDALGETPVLASGGGDDDDDDDDDMKGGVCIVSCFQVLLEGGREGAV